MNVAEIVDDMTHIINRDSIDYSLIENDFNERFAKVNYKLYKYYSIDDDFKDANDHWSSYSYANLIDGTVHYARPSGFNDPFDCNINLPTMTLAYNAEIKTYQDLVHHGYLDVPRENSMINIEDEYFNNTSHEFNQAKEHYYRKNVKECKEYAEEINEDFREQIDRFFHITCFSSRPNNVLMWSHYADKHRGFCVEYDFTGLSSMKEANYIFPVIYSNKRDTLPSFFLQCNGIERLMPTNDELIDGLRILDTKSSIWSYEEEWRGFDLTTGAELPDVSFPISKIYLGVRISDRDKNKIMRIANKKNIQVIQYTLHNDEYKLVEKRLL